MDSVIQKICLDLALISRGVEKQIGLSKFLFTANKFTWQ
jgi:hypothetical protein